MMRPVPPGAVSRRGFIATAGGALVAGACGSDEGVNLAIDDRASFDEVLDQVHTTAPEHGAGLSNHAPMAAEALVALGREDRVARYVRGYAPRLRALTAQPALAPEERGPALGEAARVAAWIATYEADLRAEHPRRVLARDWPILAPGIAAGGFHGVIRTGHALRSLGRADTASRRRELAHALGYWAARRLVLPGTPGARPQRGLDVHMALERVTKVDGFERPPRELIFERMGWVNGNAAFVEAVETVDLEALAVGAAITELAAAAARLFVTAGGIGYLHAITGLAALRAAVSWLDEPAARAGLGWAFQAVAAIHATYPSPRTIPASVRSSRRDVATLRAFGGAAGDEHAIKLVEAALREHAIAPRPELLAAADSA